MAEADLSASRMQQLRVALRTGEVTPRTAVEQALKRANSNAGRNVYIALDVGRALRDADALPARFTDTKPPLYGLPIALKDCFDLEGFVTTAGTRFYADRNAPAREDSAVATRLKSQGAVIIGKSHMHPLAYGITGENPDYGDCTQPNKAALLTGGSSSGSAASVQEGSAEAAIGTDTGGSIRAPAAFCGLAGYRASIELAYKRGLWRGGVHLAQSFDTLGWLFRDLRDAPLLAAALFDFEMAKDDEGEVSPGSRAVGSMKARIGVVAADFLHDANAAVRNAFAQFQERLQDFGAEVVAIDSSYWEQAMSIYAPIQASEAAAIHLPATGGDFSHFPSNIAERLAWGLSLTAEEIAEFRRQHAEFRERTDHLLSSFDFIVLPCAPVSHLDAGADHSNARRAILRYTTPLSLAGTPVVTLPGANGAGIQLTAARGADTRLLAYAAKLQGATST
jgi:Asp-tRNA(Asn)/Glu-tRNA(Gln) amidotransferase A subunit family amidase